MGKPNTGSPPWLLQYFTNTPGTLNPVSGKKRSAGTVVAVGDAGVAVLVGVPVVRVPEARLVGVRVAPRTVRPVGVVVVEPRVAVLDTSPVGTPVLVAVDSCFVVLAVPAGAV